MKNILSEALLSSIGVLFFFILTANAYAQEPIMKTDLTGYQGKLGTLFYGSEQDDIDYFHISARHLWLYNIESGLLRVLDSSKVQIGSKKIKFKYETRPDKRIILWDKVSFFDNAEGEETVFIEQNRGNKGSYLHANVISEKGKLKSKKTGLGKNIIHSRSYPLEGGGLLSVQETYHNNFYLIKGHLLSGAQADTLLMVERNTNSTVESIQPNILLTRSGESSFYLLDKFKLELYSVNSSNGTMKKVYGKNDLRDVFSYTKLGMTRDIKLLFDPINSNLYFVCRKNKGRKISTHIYHVTEERIEEITVPGYKVEFDPFFKVHQIHDHKIYFLSRGYISSKKKYIHYLPIPKLVSKEVETNKTR